MYVKATVKMHALLCTQMHAHTERCMLQYVLYIHTV